MWLASKTNRHSGDARDDQRLDLVKMTKKTPGRPPLTPTQLKNLPALEELRGKELTWKDDLFGGAATPNGLGGDQSIFR